MGFWKMTIAVALGTTIAMGVTTVAAISFMVPYMEYMMYVIGVTK
jgi:hypothetical protein